MATRAQYYKKLEGAVRCELCPHHCFIREGERGLCSVRQVRDGELYSLSDGYISSMAYDPIEKKPLSHYLPGTILSIGSFGCNFHCDFCQNHRLLDPGVRKIRVEDDFLLKAAKEKASLGIAYTYNEPIINFEMVKRLAMKIHQQGQVNVLVTNGYIEREPRRELLGLIDAWSIDYKMPEELYPKICGGREDRVLETIKEVREDAHLEVTILLIPGRNTQEEVFRGMIEKLAGIGEDIPLHLTRYFPSYKCDLPATDLKTLLACRDLAKKYMKRVELGNIP